MKSKSLLAIVVFCALLPEPARAGEGELVEDGDGDVHILNLNYHFRFAPTTTEIDLVKSQMTHASETLCDATDGQMRIGTVSLNAGGPNDGDGDIWHHTTDGRSGVGGIPDKGLLGRKGKYVSLHYDDVQSTIIAHELGHYVFGALDQYDEQRRWNGPCGIGRSFEPTMQTDRNGVPFSKNETNHSLMEGSPSRRCAVPDPANPGMFTAIVPTDNCLTDAECTGMNESCEPFLSSELSVESNTDIVQGDNMSCDDAATAGVFSPCCGVQIATSDMVLSGTLNRTSATVASGADAFDPADFDSAADTAEFKREDVRAG